MEDPPSVPPDIRGDVAKTLDQIRLPPFRPPGCSARWEQIEKDVAHLLVSTEHMVPLRKFGRRALSTSLTLTRSSHLFGAISASLGLSQMAPFVIDNVQVSSGRTLNLRGMDGPGRPWVRRLVLRGLDGDSIPCMATFDDRQRPSHFTVQLPVPTPGAQLVLLGLRGSRAIPVKCKMGDALAWAKPGMAISKLPSGEAYWRVVCDDVGLKLHGEGPVGLASILAVRSGIGGVSFRLKSNVISASDESHLVVRQRSQSGLFTVPLKFEAGSAEVFVRGTDFEAWMKAEKSQDLTWDIWIQKGAYRERLTLGLPGIDLPRNVYRYPWAHVTGEKVRLKLRPYWTLDGKLALISSRALLPPHSKETWDA